MVFASRLRSLASTRGEHPLVFSFMSRRSSGAGLVSGDSYPSISRMHLRALSTGAPHTNGFGMSLETLGFRERQHDWRDGLQAGRGKMLHGDGLQEILHAQAAAKASCCAGGQDVIRAGSVITCRLGRVVADKN